MANDPKPATKPDVATGSATVPPKLDVAVPDDVATGSATVPPKPATKADVPLPDDVDALKAEVERLKAENERLREKLERRGAPLSEGVRADVEMHGSALDPTTGRRITRDDIE